MNANGSSQVQLTFNNNRNDAFPSWSPDGLKIAFSSNRLAPNNADIFTMNADGTLQARLSCDPGDDHHPSWSRSGARLVFQGSDGDWEIWRVAANGSGLTKLSANTRIDVAPGW